MIVTVLWLVLLGAGLGWEAWCRLGRRHATSLAAILTVWWGRRPGRLLLVAVWAFLGWHFFSRYTIPHT